MIHYIGLDCHRKLAHACHMDSSGEIVLRVDLHATHAGLTAYASAHLSKQDAVAIEASFYSRQIAQTLMPFVGRVVVSNPMQTKAIAQSKKKTDKVDARVLADLLRLDYLPEVWLPDPETQKRRNLCARRGSLIKERTRVKNRIHSVLAAALIPVEVSDLFGSTGLAWLKQLGLDGDRSAAIESEQRLLETLNSEIGKLDAAMAANGWADPRIRLLITIPGVSITVAESLLAAIGNVDRFPTPEQLASYLGLVPSVHQSGDTCYRGHITRRGNRTARAMLAEAAQNIAAQPGPLGCKFRRLLTRKTRNVAVCACARKLAVIAWQMLKHNEPYRYAQPATVAGKLSRVRMAATHERLKPGPRVPMAGADRIPEGVRTRTTPSLPAVYEREGLPRARNPRQVSPAELRMLREQGAEEFFRSIQRSKTTILESAGKKADKQPGKAGIAPSTSNSI